MPRTGAMLQHLKSFLTARFQPWQENLVQFLFRRTLFRRREPKDSFSWSHLWPHALPNVKNSVAKTSFLYLGFTSSNPQSLSEYQHQSFLRIDESLAFSENMFRK